MNAEHKTTTSIPGEIKYYADTTGSNGTGPIGTIYHPNNEKTYYEQLDKREREREWEWDQAEEQHQWLADTSAKRDQLMAAHYRRIVSIFR